MEATWSEPGEMVVENPPRDLWASIESSARAAGRQLCVDLLAYREGKIYLQRRSADRRLYPNCWEPVGGHVEAGESLLEAVERELLEETGCTLVRVVSLVGINDWEVKLEWQKDGDNPLKRTVQFVVEVDGEPVLEHGKVSEGRWVGEEDLPAILAQNAVYKDPYVVELCNRVFRDTQK